jgi:hypothetical protein
VSASWPCWGDLLTQPQHHHRLTQRDARLAHAYQADAAQPASTSGAISSPSTLSSGAPFARTASTAGTPASRISRPYLRQCAR